MASDPPPPISPASPVIHPNATNTLIIAHLPSHVFLPPNQLAIRNYFSAPRATPPRPPLDTTQSQSYSQSTVHLLHWAPLPSFARILAVYDSPTIASIVKRHMDRTILLSPSSPDESSSSVHPYLDLDHSTRHIIRVYFGPSTPPSLLNSLNGHSQLEQQLDVPATDKNFLISPPGSPPVGWEQIREDGPNTMTLADDLIDALRRLGMQEGVEQGEGDEAVEGLGLGATGSDSGGAAAVAQGATNDIDPDPRQLIILLPPPTSTLPTLTVSDHTPAPPSTSTSTSTSSLSPSSSPAPATLNGQPISLSAFPRGVPRAPTPRPEPPRRNSSLENGGGRGTKSANGSSSSGIERVKATVESMRGPADGGLASATRSGTATPSKSLGDGLGGAAGGGGARITPTARPPLVSVGSGDRS